MFGVVTIAEAQSKIAAAVMPTEKRLVLPLEQACGAINACTIYSPENLPAFSRSTVDGYALRAQDTFGCSDSLPAQLRYSGKIQMGEAAERRIQAGDCMEIPTGGQLPQGADAVAMVEHTEDFQDGFRYIHKPCAPHENAVLVGEDCAAGAPILPAGTRLAPKHIAVLAALGITKLQTICPPKIAVLSTGNELVDCEQTPVGTQVRNVNSVLLCSLLRQAGAQVQSYPILPDEAACLRDALADALQNCDMVVISGGSSVGEKDTVSRVLQEFGEIRFHGVAVKPGKPTMFAVCRQKPVFGLPGHPAAAFFACMLFVKPALEIWYGTSRTPHTVQASLTCNLPSNHGRAEVVAVKLLANNRAAPLFAKSGMVAFLAQADGYLLIPRDCEGLEKNSAVEVHLF